MKLYSERIFILLDSALFLRIMTRQLLVRLEGNGDISYWQVEVFYNAVREFYCTGATCALANLPLKDSLL